MRVSKADIKDHIQVLEDMIADEQEQLEDDYDQFGEVDPNQLAILLGPIITSLEAVLDELEVQQVAHDFVNRLGNLTITNQEN